MRFSNTNPNNHEFQQILVFHSGNIWRELWASSHVLPCSFVHPGLTGVWTCWPLRPLSLSMADQTTSGLGGSLGGVRSGTQ